MKKRVKWEPAAAMVAVMLVGVLLVMRPGDLRRYELREGATKQELLAGHQRGVIETVVDPRTQEASFRLLTRDGHASAVMSEQEFKTFFGEKAYQDAMTTRSNAVFQLLNITSWFSMAWVAIGFAGQLLFSGRMLVQWFLSEKRRESVMPEVFWWLSLAGGVMLFTYFVWRRDVIAVLGQTSGLVIYARNIRLIGKQKRRAARHGAAPGPAAAVVPGS